MKAIRMLMAAAIAFLAIIGAPAQSEASSSLDVQLSKAKSTMKSPYDRYVKSTKSLVSFKTIESYIQSAKKAEAGAIKAINKTKLSTSAKKKKIADVKKYEVYIKRAQGYVNTYKAATADRNALQKQYAELENTATTRNGVKITEQYEVLQKAIKAAEKKIQAGVYGYKIRGLLYNKFTNLTEDRLAEVEKVLVELKAVPTVDSISASNVTTLTVIGRALNKLTAADVTVEGNKVATYSAAADGKSATVTLQGTLPANTDVKVTVKDSVSVRDYYVTYSFHPKAVAVQGATYDDDTKGQKLTITVDGVATSIDYLQSAGYTIEFKAFDSDGASANAVLFGSVTANSDGEFQDAVLPSGDYTVQVIISNGSTILTSEKASISVENLDKVATAINSYELTNHAGFVHESSTLVFRETATLSKVMISVGESLAELAPGSFEVKSSDETVVAANSATGVLTAQGLGTAKVTIKVGKVTKEITVTVKGEARKATKVTPDTNSIKVIIGASSPSINRVKVTDQYGDPVVSAKTGVFVHYPIYISGYASTYTTAGGEELNTSGTTNGEVTIPLAGATTAGQTGMVFLKNADKDIIGGFTVTTTEVNNVASLKLVYTEVSESKDDTIYAELASDDTISYKISRYTSEDVFNGDLGLGELTGYKVMFNGKVISINGDTTGNYALKANDATINVGIEGAGTTDLAVFKPNGMLLVKKTVTVVKDTAKIVSVDWESTPVINYTSILNYKTVLDITEGAGSRDDIMKGITLSSPVLNKIRMAESANAKTGGFIDGDLYIDKNANGVSDIGDRLIGKLAYFISPNATGELTNVSTIGNGFSGLSVTEGSPAKGIVTFFITDETSSDSSKPVVATKAVIVDVK